MNTRYSKLAMAFLLLILMVPLVTADDPPKDGLYTQWHNNGHKKIRGPL